jgi:carboxylesterase type B
LPSQEIFPGSGAWHGIELEYIFGTMRNSTGRSKDKITQNDMKLMDLMMKTWADFAKDPDKGLPWPKVGSADNDLGVIDADATIRAVNPAVVDRNCRLYEKLYEGNA